MSYRRMLVRVAALGLGVFASLAGPSAFAKGPSDDQIRIILLRESLASYPGNCPCPDNLDRAGRRCGKRSAYSKPGGYSPLCYPSDVTPGMIKEWRARQQQAVS
jgi:hypothetical protein